MRIAHLSSMNGFYGGEVCLLNLAVGLQGRGHSVSCVVRPDSRLRRELRARQVEVFSLPLVDWFEPVSVARLRRWLIRRDIQILHGTTLCNLHHQIPAIKSPLSGDSLKDRVYLDQPCVFEDISDEGDCKQRFDS